MRTLFLLSLVVVIFLFTTSGKMMVNAQPSCNFRAYHMQCSEDECSKFCIANYGQNAPSHCMNPITCCCEGSKVAAAETGTCNFTPYPLPKCTSEICSKLCSADFGPSTEYECVNSKTCCCHAATN
ncbi:hypothetical protein ACOSP7_021921 [Xanthoceras sorbifolium]